MSKTGPAVMAQPASLLSHVFAASYFVVLSPPSDGTGATEWTALCWQTGLMRLSCVVASCWYFGAAPTANSHNANQTQQVGT